MALSKLMRDAGNVAIAQATWGGSQNFLGASWVAGLVQGSPARIREPLALRMLALSPHYFYDRDIRAESERNRQSRRVIAETLIAPLLTPSSRVIDYGCGPGYMARAVARVARRVEAVDISPGVLACARAINHAENISYQTPAELARRSGQADLAYSFAVVQHLSTPALTSALALLARKVAPGGTLLLHFAVPGDQGWRAEEAWTGDRSATGRLRLHYGLNCFGRSAAQMEAAVAAAGFTDAATRSLDGVLAVPGDDDIPHQHLLTARRP
jgi:SAM-dependent methyltransferase